MNRHQNRLLPHRRTRTSDPIPEHSRPVKDKKLSTETCSTCLLAMNDAGVLGSRRSQSACAMLPMLLMVIKPMPVMRPIIRKSCQNSGCGRSRRPRMSVCGRLGISCASSVVDLCFISPKLSDSDGKSEESSESLIVESKSSWVELPWVAPGVVAECCLWCGDESARSVLRNAVFRSSCGENAFCSC